jgi:hypothetical protein
MVQVLGLIDKLPGCVIITLVKRLSGVGQYFPRFLTIMLGLGLGDLV